MSKRMAIEDPGLRNRPDYPARRISNAVPFSRQRSFQALPAGQQRQQVPGDEGGEENIGEVEQARSRGTPAVDGHGDGEQLERKQPDQGRRGNGEREPHHGVGLLRAAGQEDQRGQDVQQLQVGELDQQAHSTNSRANAGAGE